MNKITSPQGMVRAHAYTVVAAQPVNAQGPAGGQLMMVQVGGG